MLKNLSTKIKSLAVNLAEQFRLKVIRPIQKRQRRRAFLRNQTYVRQATGELIDKFEPFLMQLLDQSLADYHEAMPQNHYTVQARHDIRKLYEIRLKSLISSQK